MAVSRASSAAVAAPPPRLPPAAAKKGFLRRVLPFILTANLAVGGHLSHSRFRANLHLHSQALLLLPLSGGLRVVRAKITVTARS